MQQPSGSDGLNHVAVSRDSGSQLAALMGHENAALLVRLLKSIIDDTGFGGIEIVLSNGRVQTQKLTQSFRAKENVIIAEKE
jgi:hypothetical protein